MGYFFFVSYASGMFLQAVLPVGIIPKRFLIIAYIPAYKLAF